MILQDLYRIIASYQEVKIYNDDFTELLFEGYSRELTCQENIHLLNYKITWLDSVNDVFKITLDF